MTGADPLLYFRDMVDHCLAQAESARRAGRPVVGILCEYTPRELILAAGGVPVCLCGGDAEMIPPAEESLPANLCPLIKSTFGYHLTRSNPFLEMADLVVAETTCDGKKKMYELMAQDRPMYVLELPQKALDPDALAHWTAELRKFRLFLQRRYGRVITRRRLEDAARTTNRYRSVRRRLAGLMARPRPPLTGKELWDLNSLIGCSPEDLEQYRRALAVLRRRAAPPEAAGKVRVLLTGVPMPHGAGKVIDVIENAGGLIVCMENCTGLKPHLEDVDLSAGDLLAAIARKYFHLPCSVLTPNRRRLDLLRRLARRFRPQCVIEAVWQACLTYDVESATVRQFVQRDLGLPYLRISTDYSPGDSASLSLRVEALMETVRGRGGGSPGGREASP
jgi:benzoyl-CoA reductase/2-hydroxyglutaryl-CoA dehydratase subunit BcrC/BadD/HgdB